MDIGALNERIKQESEFVELLNMELGKAIVGQKYMAERLMLALLSNGHILLEGVPGLAKTLAIKSLASAINGKFSRIQFTPDLLPADLIGTMIYNQKENDFAVKKGPVFANFVLADEINRAPAKVQSALLEAMQEKQVTIGENTYKLEEPFLVLATQNPIEQEGTYNLPEAQLDRFLFKIKINYPTLTEEQEILMRYKNNIKAPDLNSIKGVFNATDLQKVQDLVAQVKIEDQILKYISQITDKTRNHAKLYLGGSPRASLSMMKASKAFAAIRGRDFVIPDDVQFVAPHVLNHRLILTPEAEMEGMTTEDLIKEIIQEVEVPR